MIAFEFIDTAAINSWSLETQNIVSCWGQCLFYLLLYPQHLWAAIAAVSVWNEGCMRPTCRERERESRTDTEMSEITKQL